MKFKLPNIIVPVFAFALSYTASVQAYKKPEGPPTLSSAYIVFHVQDDDKDHDSYEGITVNVGQYRIGNLSSVGSGTRWKDHSDTPPLYLDNIDHNIESSDCDKIHVDIHHSTNGHDNFKFTFSVVLSFTDGSTFTYEQTEKATLTKKSGQGAWDIVNKK